MDLGLNGKRALVTGSSTGMGEAIAHALAREGVQVVVHGRDAAKTEAVAGAIKQAGGRSAIAVGDLSDDAACEQVAASALAAFGGLDILVNNAGGLDQIGWFTGKPEDWATDYQRHVVSVVRLVQAIVPTMREAGWGRIINVASIGADIPVRKGLDGPQYAASKAALVNATVGLAQALAGTGITVNAISPGLIFSKNVTDLVMASAKQFGWPEDLDSIERLLVENVIPNPSNRAGRPEEAGALVAFLASECAGYVNGCNIRLDGGANPSIN